jgi:hypothetical protein
VRVEKIVQIQTGAVTLGWMLVQMNVLLLNTTALAVTVIVVQRNQLHHPSIGSFSIVFGHSLFKTKLLRSMFETVRREVTEEWRKLCSKVIVHILHLVLLGFWNTTA